MSQGFSNFTVKAENKEKIEQLIYTLNELEKVAPEASKKYIESMRALANNASGMNQRKGIIDEIEKVIFKTFYQNEEDATNYYTDKMNRKKNYGGKYNEKFLEYGNQPPEEETDEEAE